MFLMLWPENYLNVICNTVHVAENKRVPSIEVPSYDSLYPAEDIPIFLTYFISLIIYSNWKIKNAGCTTEAIITIIVLDWLMVWMNVKVKPLQNESYLTEVCKRRCPFYSRGKKYNYWYTRPEIAYTRLIFEFNNWALNLDPTYLGCCRKSWLHWKKGYLW